MDGLPKLPSKLRHLTFARVVSQLFPRVVVHGAVLGIAAGITAGITSAALAPGAAQAANRASASSASDDESDVEGYDAIIHGLNREYERPAALKARASTSAADGLDGIWFHGGAGFTTMMETLDFDDGSTMYLTMKGIQVAGGIDLFSPSWRAEGTLRNFGETTDQPTHVSLQEFELKLLFHERLNPQLGFHAGAGLSARYMTIHRPIPKGSKAGGLIQNNGDYVTPTSLATGGFDFYLNDRITLGFELSARNAVVAETIDRNSLDATLRMDLQL